MQLSIVEFSDRLAPEFHRINVEWIQDLFTLEETDLYLLENPRETIVDRGGAILFVEDEQHRVLGTCALLRVDEGALELTKMGVSAEARGKKAGEFLLHAALRKARDLEAELLYLLTSTKCQAAIHLYEKVGFVHDARIMESYGARYARCDVAMSYPPAQLWATGRADR